MALSKCGPYPLEGGQEDWTGRRQEHGVRRIHFPIVTLPLFYGTQAGNFTSVNPSVKWEYHHPLLMGCSEHLNEN